jgi:hypothetical protein
MAAAVVAACSAGDAPGTSRNSNPGTTPQAGPGTAGNAAPSQPGGFGNTTAMAPMAPPATIAPGDDGCVVGQFCESMDPDPDDCGSLTLEAEVEVIEKPGNVLLVFDTSGSMAMDWNGMTRWEQAGPAVINALMPLADKLTIGTVFFPRADPNAPLQCIDPTGITCIFLPQLMVAGGTCGVTPITSTDQINFMPGPAFLTRFGSGAAPAYAPVPGGFTPLKEGLQQAQMALSSATLTGITSVVVVTDGDPNCMWDAAVSQQIVTGWNAMGIKTYVIGLPGTTGAGNMVLNQLAMAGGTGQYIPANDPSTLQMNLSMIATETVMAGFDSCEITINPPAEAPEKLHLVVTEGGMDQDVARDLADDYKWNINGDGSLVTLEGRLCDDAMSGRFAALRFEFGCVEIPPLPPPPPVE